MKTSVNRIVTMAAGAMFLGTMAFAQTQMKAQVPFAFRTPNGTLPAGEYNVGRHDQKSGSAIATLENRATNRKVFVAGVANDWNAGKTSLVFRCTEVGGCQLAELRMSDRTITYRTVKSAREKEAAFVVIPLRPTNAD